MRTKIKQYKKESDYSYTLGVFPTLELIAWKPEQIVRIILHSKGNTNNGIQKIIQHCNKMNLAFTYDDKLVNSLGNGNSYVIGIFKKYESTVTAGNHLLLVNPEDMGNVGTIIRTALGFGIDNIAIIKPHIDIFHPRVIRSSMGACFHTRIESFDSFISYTTLFKNILYSFMTDGATALNELSFISPYTLIFGNEGSGLPAEYSSFTESIRIPQCDVIDSLSLPISVGIVLYATTL